MNGNTTNNIKMLMIPKTVSGTVASSSGGDVDIFGGAKISFGIGSFVSAGDSSNYSGGVSVAGYF